MRTCDLISYTYSKHFTVIPIEIIFVISFLNFANNAK